MPAPVVLFYVQHLLGTGHLRRVVLLAQAMAARGLVVELVSGGLPVADLDYSGMRLHQLPPLAARDARFSALVDAAGREPDAAYLARRREQLLALFHALRPAALITESFPFGRRQLRFELLPLLAAVAAARPRPLLAASIRDVQQARKPQRIAETLALVREHYDYVLVHGDPAFLPLEASFPAAAELGERLIYTGLVASPAPAAAPGGVGAGAVLVSAGGGAVGLRLYRTALAAHALTQARQRPWRLLVGHNLNAATFAELRANAPAGVSVERARPDFPQLLARCALSVSQAGYNTVMDLLRAGTRAVLVPFQGSGETEQVLRAARLQALGLARVVEETQLSPATLAAAVDAALTTPQVPAPALALDGAERSAALLASWLGVSAPEGVI
ncbi:MAG TPA: glycosyltransferase [Candidatus Competibacteraceae bacterium]|nr:glycosyltransferase [Candidatus Competibacteraceae bacterium]